MRVHPFSFKGGYLSMRDGKPLESIFASNTKGSNYWIIGGD